MDGRAPWCVINARPATRTPWPATGVAGTGGGGRGRLAGGLDRAAGEWWRCTRRPYRPLMHPAAARPATGGSLHLAHHAAVVVFSGVTFTPTLSQLPGSTALKNIINGVGAWALFLCLAGLLVGAALWAIGSHSQNYQQSYVGRRAVLVSALAALVVGLAPVIVNFFFHTGHSITTAGT